MLHKAMMEVSYLGRLMYVFYYVVVIIIVLVRVFIYYLCFYGSAWRWNGYCCIFHIYPGVIVYYQSIEFNTSVGRYTCTWRTLQQRKFLLFCWLNKQLHWLKALFPAVSVLHLSASCWSYVYCHPFICSACLSSLPLLCQFLKYFSYLQARLFFTYIHPQLARPSLFLASFVFAFWF